ncbi:hypothetical protein JCM6882_003399 [Rhodosporidiobolus microsporus]
MIPPLPQPVLERIVRFLLAEARRTKSPSVMKSFPLVCRAWAHALLAVKWGASNTLSEFSRDEGSGQVGDLCQAIAVPFVVALHMKDVPDEWLRLDLHHFTSTLVWLALVFVDRPAQGLAKLPSCTHLERLELVCSPKHQGNLHDVLDVLRYLPTLEHLSLAHFHAPTLPLSAAKNSASYTVPANLTTLGLESITGPRARELLQQAFDPALTFSLSNLALSNLGNPLTLALISNFHSTLSHLSYSLVCPSFLDAGKLLPLVPFPRLRNVTLQVLPIQSPILYIRTINNLVMSYIMDRVPDFHLHPLDTFFLVEVDVWTEHEVASALEAFRDPNHPSDIVRALAAVQADLLNDRQYSARKTIELMAVRILANVFEVEEAGTQNILGEELKLFDDEVILAKGRKLREEKAKEEGKEEK